MTEKPKVPKFESEAEEAQWWDQHREETAQWVEEAVAAGETTTLSDVLERARERPRRATEPPQKAAKARKTNRAPNGSRVANPNDVIRDAILRHLHEVHSRARSPKTAGLKINELTRTLKPQGFKQQEIARNLDYLVQKGWVREVIENRTFTTPRGTTQVSEKRGYKISDTGIDRLEAASTYQMSAVAGHINVTNIHGVTVVGDGNVVNTTFTDLSRALADMKEAVLREPTLENNQKLNIVADIDSLQAQLQKPEPQKSIVQTLWSGIERVAAVGGVIDVAHRVSELIQPLVK